MALGGVSVEDIDAVLLDGLGTLVALEPPAPMLVQRLREAHGVELAPADAERAFAAEIAYYRAHHHEGRDPTALAELRRRCAEALRSQLPAAVAQALSLAQLTEAMLQSLRFAPYPDARPALARLHARGLALVVVSNWDASLPTVLHEAGLGELVDGVVTSAEIAHPKPHRAIFAAALALAGSAPERTLHVGDSIEHDVDGARAAGIHAVLLRRDSAGNLPAAAATRHVPTISSLAQLLA